MMKLGKIFSWMFWGTAGLLILYLAYAAIDERLSLQKYEAAFARVQHPVGTILLDTIALRYSYYPATYVDESIRCQSAYLVGELRQYAGNWVDIKLFYHKNQRLEKPIVALPLVIRQNEQRLQLAILDGFVFDPSKAHIILSLQDHYGSRGIPENLDGTEQNLYLAYSLWVQDDR